MNLEATLFAWKNGIAAIEKAGTWRGYVVFAPKYAADGQRRDLILADSSGARFASAEEAAACASSLAG